MHTLHACTELGRPIGRPRSAAARRWCEQNLQFFVVATGSGSSGSEWHGRLGVGRVVTDRAGWGGVPWPRAGRCGGRRRMGRATAKWDARGRGGLAPWPQLAASRPAARRRAAWPRLLTGAKGRGARARFPVFSPCAAPCGSGETRARGTGAGWRLPRMRAKLRQSGRATMDRWNQ